MQKYGYSTVVPRNIQDMNVTFRDSCIVFNGHYYDSRFRHQVNPSAVRCVPL